MLDLVFRYFCQTPIQRIFKNWLLTNEENFADALSIREKIHYAEEKGEKILFSLLIINSKAGNHVIAISDCCNIKC